MAFAKFPASSLRIVFARIAGFVGLALLFTTWAFGEEEAAKPVAKKPVDYEALIENVANRKNKAPEMVNRLGFGTFPVFFEDYHYGEQSRVEGAIQKLAQNSGEELWSHLIEHLEDTRYALTCSRGPEDDESVSLTVGMVCRMIAERSVDWPCERHRPHVRKGEKRVAQSFPRMRGHGLSNIQLAAWAKEQQGKPLYELQREQCQYVIDNPELLRGFSAEQAERLIRAYSQEIAELERTEKPIDTDRFVRTTTPLYTDRIKKYRLEYGELAKARISKREVQNESSDKPKEE